MSSSCRSALGAAALSLACAQASGAALQFEPRIEVQALHDDNYRLTDVPDAELEVTGGFLDAALAFRSSDPLTSVELVPRVRTSMFPDEESEESTDVFLGFDWRTQTQRLEKRVAVQYSDESVVTSERLASDFPDLDLGDVVVGDSGRLSLRNRRDLISVRPALSYRWTPRHRLEAGLSYIDASYDRNLVEQRGYSDLLATGGIGFDFTQRDSLAGRLKFGVYEPEGAISETERAGIEGEWSRQLSPTMRFYARGGVESTRTEVLTLDPQRLPVRVSISDEAMVGGIGAAWAYEVTQILLDAIRSVSPSSEGAVVDRDEIRLRLRREVRARLAFFGSLRGIRTEGAVEEVRAIRDRESLSGRLGFEWRMTRPLRVIGAFDYAWQQFEAEPSDATSNAFTVSFVYEPERRDLSQ